MVDLKTFLDSEASASLLTPSLVDPSTVKKIATQATVLMHLLVSCGLQYQTSSRKSPPHVWS